MKKPFGIKLKRKRFKTLWKVKIPYYPDMYFTSRKDAETWIKFWFTPKTRKKRKIKIIQMRNGFARKLKYNKQELVSIVVPKERKKKEFFEV